MKLPGRNLNIKLIALTLALATWFAVRSRTIEESDWLVCPVTVALPDNVIAQEQGELSVQIKVQGPVEKIADFRAEQWPLSIDARADVQEALGGDTATATLRLRITKNDFQLPGRIALKEFKPDSVQLKVGRRQRKVLPIEVTTFGRVADGYQVVEKRAMRSTFPLDLGAEEAARISVLETTPVDITGRTQSVRETAVLLDPRDATRSQELAESVEVVVTIAPMLHEIVLEPVPIMLLKRPNDRSRVEVDPGTIAITVRGRADLLAGLGPEAATAYVSIGKAMTPGTYTLLPVVTIGTRGVEVDPKSVPEVTVTITE